MLPDSRGKERRLTPPVPRGTVRKSVRAAEARADAIRKADPGEIRGLVREAGRRAEDLRTVREAEAREAAIPREAPEEIRAPVKETAWRAEDLRNAREAEVREAAKAEAAEVRAPVRAVL